MEPGDEARYPVNVSRTHFKTLVQRTPPLKRGHPVNLDTWSCPMGVRNRDNV